MKWDSSFAIGITVIDNQHKKIFEHLLAVENSVVKRDPWHIVRFQVAQLSDYLKLHVAVEEALLEIIGYPDLADHADAHTRLIAEIAKLEDQLQHNASPQALIGFFEHWFVDHVLNTDRQYAAYVAKEFPSLPGITRTPAS